MMHAYSSLLFLDVKYSKLRTAPDYCDYDHNEIVREGIPDVESDSCPVAVAPPTSLHQLAYTNEQQVRSYRPLRQIVCVRALQ